MVFDNFGNRDYTANAGRYMYGRVKEYSHHKGYGWILTENRKELFVSSYDLGKKLENKIGIGVLLKFVPEKVDNKYKASNIEIIDNSFANDRIKLPNGVNLKVKGITQFAYVSGNSTIRVKNISPEEVAEKGYTADDLAHMYFKTVLGDEFVVSEMGSPINIDGQVNNLKDFYMSLVERYWYV